jgi:hypothetical protein
LVRCGIAGIVVIPSQAPPRCCHASICEPPTTLITRIVRALLAS